MNANEREFYLLFSCTVVNGVHDGWDQEALMMLQRNSIGSFRILLVVSCVFLGAPGTPYPPGAARAALALQRPDGTLAIQFSVPKGKLIRAVTSHFTRPVEASMSLLYREGSRDTVLSSMKDLKGRVRIDTDRAALSFVRLRTSLSTFFLFDQADELEIISKSKITPDFLFGDTDKLKHLKASRNGMHATVDPKVAAKLGLPDPTVRQVKDGFEIKRLLLREKSSATYETYSVNMVVEWVGPDGSYKVVSRTPYKPAKGWGFQWYWPMFL